jgi:hypothetical protein
MDGAIRARDWARSRELDAHGRNHQLGPSRLPQFRQMMPSHGPWLRHLEHCQLE